MVSLDKTEREEGEERRGGAYVVTGAVLQESVMLLLRVVRQSLEEAVVS